ncbi:hypothetical protein EDB89DRAFT_1907716 [Lactarius sanguifluus]|nr:hypothetical protein EDB89DRAFT_1907716 [Lactarius sanguifluus]
MSSLSLLLLLLPPPSLLLLPPPLLLLSILLLWSSRSSAQGWQDSHDLDGHQPPPPLQDNFHGNDDDNSNTNHDNSNTNHDNSNTNRDASDINNNASDTNNNDKTTSTTTTRHDSDDSEFCSRGLIVVVYSKKPTEPIIWDSGATDDNRLAKVWLQLHWAGPNDQPVAIAVAAK